MVSHKSPLSFEKKNEDAKFPQRPALIRITS